jgi:hypothetical protein
MSYQRAPFGRGFVFRGESSFGQWLKLIVARILDTSRLLSPDLVKRA